MFYQLQSNADHWASIVTALATGVLAFLTWRTVRAMTKQITVPKRDKHLEWLHAALLAPLKGYLESFLVPMIGQGLLPISGTLNWDDLSPQVLTPYDNLPLLKSELTAHFKQLDDVLSAFVIKYQTFTDRVLSSIKRECGSPIAEKLAGESSEKIIHYCYRTVFSALQHSKPNTLLFSDGTWHLKGEVDPLILDIEVESKDAADKLRAALWQAVTKSRSELMSDFLDICSEWRRLLEVLDLALAEVQLRGKCVICPFS